MSLILLVLADSIRRKNVGEDLTELVDSLQDDVDVFGVLAKLKKVFQLAVAVCWKADDFVCDDLRKANLFGESERLEHFVGKLVFVSFRLALLNLYLFELLRGKYLARLYGLAAFESLLIGFLFESILSFLLDLATLFFFLFAFLVSGLLSEGFHIRRHS